MSKVSTYLQSHIVGEVSVRTDVRQALSFDGGILQVTPDMVIYPRATNDIRKVARFVWQLAEKGHPLSITVRGAGTDTSGAAVGSGVALVTTAHMHEIFEYDTKQKLVRLQAGASLASLDQALALHGTTIKALRGSYSAGTIGGAVANAVCGPYASAHTLVEAVDQLEVVLANGDVLQTERISKRELNRRKGQEGFVGDIYRGIDGIIEEYADVIEKLAPGDYAGYNAIADVKRKDGSFDLAPLFIGSQGTLGIITEMIMKTQERPTHRAAAVLVFDNREKARDALDVLQTFHPQYVEYFDGIFFERAVQAGKSYSFYRAGDKAPVSVVVAGFEDVSERHVKKSLKKLGKVFANSKDADLTILENDGLLELSALLDIVQYTAAPDHVEVEAPSVYTGFQVPLTQFEVFCKGLDDLAAREHVALPLAGHVATGIYGVYPSLSLKKVGDKQKALKLIDELVKLVTACDGIFVAEGGEGILSARSVRTRLDPRLVEMHDAVRKLLDPHGTLNPGVKQDVDLRKLASQLRSDPAVGQLARFGL